MFGQIATFVEELHLTYHDVFEVIPYRVLMLMQKDKLRVLYDSEVMQEVTEDEFFRGRNKKI